jgi:hypothetical protein
MTAVTGDPDGLSEPETFAAFADRIGKSRPYVSKLKAEGKIGARCFAADGRIIPRLALEDMAANADPARRKAPAITTEGADATFARQRARKTAAEAERAEIELRARKGDLVERAIVAGTLAPWVRELRDGILGVPRDTVLDPVQAADCESALAKVLTDFSAKLTSLATETTPDGGDPGA